MYNYFEVVKKDIRTMLVENVDIQNVEGPTTVGGEKTRILQATFNCRDFDLSIPADVEELIKTVKEDMLYSDEVTGYASGSYFSDSAKASEALCDNLDLLCDAADELCDSLWSLLREGVERCDVEVRCYAVCQVAHEVVKDMVDEWIDELTVTEDKLRAAFRKLHGRRVVEIFVEKTAEEAAEKCADGLATTSEEWGEQKQWALAHCDEVQLGFYEGVAGTAIYLDC